MGKCMAWIYLCMCLCIWKILPKYMLVKVLMWVCVFLMFIQDEIKKKENLNTISSSHTDRLRQRELWRQYRESDVMQLQTLGRIRRNSTHCDKRYKSTFQLGKWAPGEEWKKVKMWYREERTQELKLGKHNKTCISLQCNAQQTQSASFFPSPKQCLLLGLRFCQG